MLPPRMLRDWECCLIGTQAQANAPGMNALREPWAEDVCLEGGSPWTALQSVQTACAAE